MSETIIRPSELDFNLGDGASEHGGTTSAIQLAYEGLMRLVDIGRITHEDARETMDLVVAARKSN